MLRSLLVVVLLLLATLPVDAQRRRGHDGFAEKGDVALAFSIDGLVLRPFEGGVGARVWLSNKSVLATSLGFSYSTGDNDASTWSTRFSVAAERHVGSSRRVSPFVALGASVGYAETETTSYYYPPVPVCTPSDEPCPVIDVTPYPYTFQRQHTSIGLAGFLGAEVRLTEGLTLAAAHSLGIEYLRFDENTPVFFFEDCPPCDVIPFPGSNQTAERLQIGTGTSSLILSIYF